MVIKMDVNTEKLEVEVEGSAIDFGSILSTISSMGASLHSINEVEVFSEADAG